MPTGVYKRKPYTEQHLIKLRIANLGSKNPAFGKPSSKLQKETVSKIMKGNKHRLGKAPWNKGKTGYKNKPCSEERKIKVGLANRGKKRLSVCGGKHWNWKKDRNSLCRINKQGERRTSAYFYWRKQVWLRDNFKYKIANPDCNGRLEAHHILTWRDYLELRYDINNGITLCHFHHPRKKEDEKKLSPYFQQLVAEMK